MQHFEINQLMSNPNWRENISLQIAGITTVKKLVYMYAQCSIRTLELETVGGLFLKKWTIVPKDKPLERRMLRFCGRFEPTALSMVF